MRRVKKNEKKNIINAYEIATNKIDIKLVTFMDNNEE